VAVGEAVSPSPVTNDPPRRSSRLLHAWLFSCVVAIVFGLGWCGGSRLTPRIAPALAASKWAPLRVILQKAPRTLAPLQDPQPQAPAQTPATPKFFGFLVPTSAASAPPAVLPTAPPKAPVYTPTDL
jgi:hypothetical protein